MPERAKAALEGIKAKAEVDSARVRSAEGVRFWGSELVLPGFPPFPGEAEQQEHSSQADTPVEHPASNDSV